MENVDSIAKLLLPKLSETSSDSAAHVLAAFGKLVRVGGKDILYVADRLIPLFSEAMPSARRRCRR